MSQFVFIKSICLSLLFQAYVMWLVFKYSLFYMVFMEMWVILFFVFIFVIFEGSILLLWNVCGVLSLSFALELGVLYMYFSGLESNLIYYLAYSFFKQGVLILMVLVLEFSSFSLGFAVYVFNSKFVFLYYILVLYGFSNLSWFMEFMCGGRLVIMILFMFWYFCFYSFMILVYNESLSELVLGVILFSQFFCMFSLFMKFKYFLLCFWLESFLFCFYFYYMLGEGEGFSYINFLGCLNYYFYFMFFIFLFSFPPFPGLFVEMSFLLWVYFLFNSFCLIMLLVNLFCYSFIFFMVLVKVIFSYLVLDLKMICGETEGLIMVFCFLGVFKLYEMCWVLQFYF